MASPVTKGGGAVDSRDAYRDHIARKLRRPNLFLFEELAAIDFDTEVSALDWQNAAGKPARLTV